MNCLILCLWRHTLCSNSEILRIGRLHRSFWFGLVNHASYSLAAFFNKILSLTCLDALCLIMYVEAIDFIFSTHVTATLVGRGLAA